MREKKITIWNLAVKNLRKKSSQTIATLAVITIFAASVFGGGILFLSLENGLNSAKERLGADIILVPEDTEEVMKAILLQGNTSYFYMSRDMIDKVQDIDGIDQITYQYFFASAGSACCDMPVEIIGFEPDTDFVIQPWIQEKLKEKIADDSVVVGGDIQVSNGHSIRIYNQEYEVAAKMDKTGTGMDQTVFANMNTLKHMRQAATKQGFRFLSGEEEDLDKQISAVMIRVSDKDDISRIATEIKKQTKDVEVVISEKIVSSVTDSLSFIAMVVKYVLFVLIAMVLAALSVIYILQMGQRKKEIALLRMMGMSKSKIGRMLMTESMLQGILGAILGIMIASVFVFPFNVYIGDMIGQPYVQPGSLTTLSYVLGNIVLVTGASLISVSFSVAQIYKKETYQTMREGE